MIKVKRALISVSDKSGVLDFARGLTALGVEIISTGGTAKLLASAGVPVREVSDFTGFPEILDGRVKTLHPAIHAGLLALREKPEHLKQLEDHHISLIDMVVVNLYPFARVIQKKNISLEEAIENIDIGGPSMLRSAAKNYKSVAVICNPGRYTEVLKELEMNSGLLSDAVLMNLALDVFALTSQYDEVISTFLNNRLKESEISDFPRELVLRFNKAQDLRYGENPHQPAAFYRHKEEVAGLAKMTQLHGKELSFNNLLDLNAAYSFIKGFAAPAAVIIKHNNPTGIAEDKTLAKAYKEAWQADTLSAFGGIIGVNRKVDEATAQLIVKSGFMECLMAPAYDRAALALLCEKKNFRVIEFPLGVAETQPLDFRQLEGGVLVQKKDNLPDDPAGFKVVTRKKPTKTQWASLLFGWQVVRHVRSNAAVLTKGSKAVGIGCGQTSRVESVVSALKKAGPKAKGSCLASEAFLPKTDNITAAAKAGVQAIIQTGGSVADPEVIAAADKAKIAMVVTGIRHFKH